MIKLLTALRLKRKWSVSRTAREAEMHAGTISQIENGRLVPYQVQLLKLAKVFGIPASEAESLLYEVPDNG